MKNKVVLFTSSIAFIILSVFCTELYRLYLKRLSTNFNHTQYFLSIILTVTLFVICAYYLSILYKRIPFSRIDSIIIFSIGIIVLFSPLIPAIGIRISITSFMPIAGVYLLLLSVINYKRG
jgi:hypothetical protein